MEIHIRSAVNQIFQLPVNYSVKTAARKYNKTSMQYKSTQLQISFLEDLRKQKLHPKHLSNIRFPKLFQSTKQHSDLTRPLKNINYGISDTVRRNIKRYDNKIMEFRNYCHRLEISDKYCELRYQKREREIILEHLKKQTSMSIIDKIIKITSTSVKLAEAVIINKHNNKIKSIKYMVKNHKAVKQVAQTSSHPISTSNNSNVIIRVAAEFNNEGTNILQKGRNYKLTPTNSRNNRCELSQKTKIGVERMIAGVRYANFSENTNRSNTLTDDAQKLHHLSTKFDNINLWPPKVANPEIEKTLTQFRKNIEPIIKVIKTTRIPQNHSTKDTSALSDILKQPNISVLLTDKTNKICVMPKDLVETKISEHFKPPNFQELPENPSHEYSIEANSILNSCLTNVHHTAKKHTILRMQTKYATAPTISPMAKDHKKGFPETSKVRVVQPISNSAIEKLDYLVSKVLVQIVKRLNHRVDSSATFKKRLKALHNLPPDVFQASIDMENMYPSLPTDDKALNIVYGYIRKHFDHIEMYGFQPQDITTMLRFITTHTYVEANGKYFCQKSGVGTGCHSSGAYAEILVDDIYQKALMISCHKPIALSLYVDDAHSLWKNKEAFFTFLKTLNSIWQGKLRFTHEESNKNNELAFLDVKVRIRGTTLEYEPYQKATHSGQYLEYDSHCAEMIKINIISSETNRIIDNSSSLSLAWKHLENLRSNLTRSGYPKELTTITMLRTINKSMYQRKKHIKPNNGNNFILKVPYINEALTRKIRKTAIKTGLNIRVVTTPGTAVKHLLNRGNMGVTTLKNDDLIKCKRQYCVYGASCKTCNKQYTGATARPLEFRLSEHEASVRLGNRRSSLGEHILKEHPTMVPKGEDLKKRKGKRNYPDFFDRFDFEIKRTCQDTLETFLYESMDIKETKPELNVMGYNGFIF